MPKTLVDVTQNKKLLRLQDLTEIHDAELEARGV